jgi:putative hydrolase of the HAD superfamily
MKPAAFGANDNVLKAIEHCARRITTEFPKAIVGAAELLEWAFSRFDLALITRGRKDLQLKKVDHVGFRKYFRLIEVVEKKTSRTFETVIAHAGFSPSKSWVIGDSIQTDINPGIEAGARCIWYAYRHDSYYWQQEHGHTPIGEFFQISDLRDAVHILAKSAGASVRAA